MSNYLLNTISLAINSKGGRLSPQISSKEDEGRERHDLRFGAGSRARRCTSVPDCSPTHPMLFNSICPKNSKNSRLKEFKEICGDIYVAETPPLQECAVYMRVCGKLCAAGERESGRAGGGAGGERERTSLRQNHSCYHSLTYFQFTKVLKLHILERKAVFLHHFESVMWVLLTPEAARTRAVLCAAATHS